MYRYLSFDMFQTLVDVNQRIPHIWSKVYRERYTHEQAYRGARAVIEAYSAKYSEAVCAEAFIPMCELYLQSARMALRGSDIDADPGELVGHLIKEHANAPFYDEVPEVLRQLSGSYELLISSDSCHEMVDSILEKLPVRQVFISDDLLCYKADTRCRFFKRVLSETGAQPGEMLHIGDSAADIIGASACKIKTCLICRDDHPPAGVSPDYTVDDLRQLMGILREEQSI